MTIKSHVNNFQSYFVTTSLYANMILFIILSISAVAKSPTTYRTQCYYVNLLNNSGSRGCSPDVPNPNK